MLRIIVPLVLARVDALVRIQQFHIEDCGILPAHRYRPRISHRLAIRDLLRIVDRHTTERTVRVQRKERLPILTPAPRGYIEGRAVFARLRLPFIVQSGMRRHTAERPFQRDSAGDHKRAPKEIGPRRRIHCASSRPAHLVERVLKGRRVVGLRITHRSKLPDIPPARNRHRPLHCCGLRRALLQKG